MKPLPLLLLLLASVSWFFIACQGDKRDKEKTTSVQETKTIESKPFDSEKPDLETAPSAGLTASDDSSKGIGDTSKGVGDSDVFNQLVEVTQELEQSNEQLQTENVEITQKLAETLQQKKLTLEQEIQELRRNLTSLEQRREGKQNEERSLTQRTETLAQAIQTSQNKIQSLTDTRTRTSQQKQALNAELEAQMNTLKGEKAELEAHKDDFIFIRNFELVWRDHGSGAHSDVSFYHPKPPAGYVILGDYVQGDYSNPNGEVLVARQNQNVRLAEDHDSIWNDAGSGADSDFSCWRPKVPQGYKALGNITIASHERPNKQIWCVRENLLEEASLGGKIWDDGGSGADQDFSAWHIPATGLFASHASHGKPEGLYYKIKQEYTQEGMAQKIAQKAAAIASKQTKQSEALELSNRILSDTDASLNSEQTILKSKQDERDQTEKLLKKLADEIAALKAQILEKTREIEQKEQDLAQTQQELDNLNVQ